MATKNYKYKINGTVYNVAIGDIDNNVAKVQVNGVPYNVEIETSSAKPVTITQAPRATAAPRTETGEKIIATPAKASAAGGKAVKAPLPGVVLAINCKKGDEVKASDTVVTLEAMKMENAVLAGVDGRVTDILVNQGDSVQEGAVLLTIG